MNANIRLFISEESTVRFEIWLLFFFWCQQIVDVCKRVCVYAEVNKAHPFRGLIYWLVDEWNPQYLTFWPD